jgi:hypothetical protein
MRSLKLVGNSIFNKMIENNYYLINNHLLFKYSGVEIDPNNRKIVMGEGKFVDTLNGNLTMLEDPLEKIEIIPFNQVNTIQYISSIDFDELLNDSYYNYNQI